MSSRLSIRSEGRNIQLLIAAISFVLILMTGTAQTVSAFPTTQTTWVPVFYRTGCGDLGNSIQARFGWDISGGTNNTNTMTINEHGYEATRNNVTGSFKLLDFPIGEYSYGSPVVHQYPGIYSFANFLQYKQTSVNATITEPTAGLMSPTTTVSASYADSYTANIGTGNYEFKIVISQGTNDITSYFYTINSTGSVIHEYALDVSFSSVMDKPPYHEHYALTAELDGIDPGEGYANMTSGTDFQIEGLISPSTITDFTQDLVDSFKGSSGQTLSIPSCSLMSFPDEEGVNGMYTLPNSGTSTAGNEAWQYYKVTPQP